MKILASFSFRSAISDLRNVRIIMQVNECCAAELWHVLFDNFSRQNCLLGRGEGGLSTTFEGILEEFGYNFLCFGRSRC
jgi:hypothetical protein